MAEDKIYRLLAMQQQLLSGNTLNKKEAAARFEVGEKSIQRDLETLRAVFSRSGFTSAYFDGKLTKEMFGFRRREDVQACVRTPAYCPFRQRNADAASGAFRCFRAVRDCGRINGGHCSREEYIASC